MRVCRFHNNRGGITVWPDSLATAVPGEPVGGDHCSKPIFVSSIRSSFSRSVILARW